MDLIRKMISLFLSALLCALFTVGPATAEQALDLVCCEYSVYGGMENEDLSYTAKRGESRWDAVLTVSERGVATERALPWGTLDELDDFLAAYDPAGWAALPDREVYALDAPTRRIELTCADGAVYALTNDREIGGPLFAETEAFLASYLAEDAEVFELRFSSFEGGGPEYYPVLSAPEKVWISSSRAYDETGGEIAPGSGYAETLTFHGRIPGRTELTIEMYGPLTPVFETPPTVYVLEIDDEYNVRLIEE